MVMMGLVMMVTVSGQNPPGQNPLGQNPSGVGQNPTCLSFQNNKKDKQTVIK